MKSKINVMCVGGLLAIATLVASGLAADMSGSVASKQANTSVIQKTVNQTASSTRVPRGSRYPIRGKLRSVDLTAKTFTLSGSAKDRVFLTDETTVFTKNGKPATLADGVPGDEVGGLAENLPDGRVLAIKVRFGPKTEEEKQTSSRRSSGRGTARAGN